MTLELEGIVHWNGTKKETAAGKYGTLCARGRTLMAQSALARWERALEPSHRLTSTSVVPVTSGL